MMDHPNEWLEFHRCVLDKLPEDIKERINEQYDAFTKHMNGGIRFEVNEQ